MRSRFVTLLAATLVLGVSIATSACDDSATYRAPDPTPIITNASGPTGNSVVCDVDPADTGSIGGACPMTVTVAFRLPTDQFVTKGILRFQGDGSDDGTDREYLLAEDTYGLGPDKDVTVSVNAFVPPTVLRDGALFTYTIRLRTGLGEDSIPTKLTISVQQHDPNGA